MWRCHRSAVLCDAPYLCVRSRTRIESMQRRTEMVRGLSVFCLRRWEGVCCCAFCLLRGHPRCAFAARALQFCARPLRASGLRLRGAGVAPVRGGTYFSLQRQRKVGKRKPLTPPVLVLTQRAPNVPTLSTAAHSLTRAANALTSASPTSHIRTRNSHLACSKPPCGKLCVGRRTAQDTIGPRWVSFRALPYTARYPTHRCRKGAFNLRCG
jgi:hypothetical protein